MGISPSLVYSLCEGKQLAHHRIGQRGRRGKIIITEANVVEFLARTKVEAEERSRPITASPKRLGPFKHLEPPPGGRGPR